MMVTESMRSNFGRNWPFAAFAVTIGAVLAVLIWQGPPIQSDDRPLASAFLRTAVGPFLGATFAFAFAMWRENKKEDEQNCAAGNVATLVLARQLSDYNKTVASLQRFREQVLAETQVPPWMLMLPVVPRLYTADLKQDVHSLNFITSHTQGPAALQGLIDADMKYHYFFAMLEQHAVQMAVAQDRLAASGIDPLGKTPIKDLEATIGISTLMRLNSIVTAIFIAADRDNEFYENTLRLLETVLVERFKKGSVLKVRDTAQSKQPDPELSPFNRTY